MTPHIDIKKSNANYYSYSVRMGEGQVLYERHDLRSVAECLHDAATALGQAFLDLEVSYEGLALGRYSQPTLEHDTELLMRKLQRMLPDANGDT